ncbi:hypothetical protein GCM10025771_40940 [Niveibacterium umoris]
MKFISSPLARRAYAVLCALMFGLVAGTAFPSVAEAAHHHAHSASAGSHSSGKHATTKKQSHGSGSHKSGHSSSKKSSGKSKTCYETVKRKGKSVKVKKPCGEPAETVVSKSPIRQGSLEGAAAGSEGAPLKARSAPIRAYAVDGTTFFHNGRKIVVDGLPLDANAGLTHEHAAQRLQRLLDSGAVSIDPVSADDNGALRARVRVDGKDVSELMRAQP